MTNATIIKKISTLFIKAGPESAHALTHSLLDQSNLTTKTERQLQPMITYIQCLQKHKEYLQFFQINVVKDQRSKIQNVAKYVGLAIPIYPFDKDQKK